ncbi:hypothetical protein DYB28_011772 [Aphanomyces astaci]|uniref:Uncharacterized protein n=1 Tax=Aphanomyces astaci TaxID=112090 RepID=A0A9X8HEY0_APHAT|nr:hypothetical protein DYB28_011772 [Aphanomyces astaci]
MKLGLVLGLDAAGKTMLLRQVNHMRKDEFHNTKLGSVFEKCRIELTRILARVLRFTEAGLWIFRQTEKLVMRSLCRSSSYDGVSDSSNLS